MGKFRYKQPETVAALQPSDVLRKMTVKGSAVEERMDSLVRRKMVDLAKPRDPKKVYIKEYVNNEREQMIIESRSKQTSNQSAGHIPLKQI
jgi:predicted metal-dependent peptidase